MTIRSTCLFVVLVLGAVCAESADWPHWRGPNRNDVTTEPSGWDGKSWIKGQMWQASVGEGSSSPIVVGNRVYLTGWSSNRDTLFCLDANSGRELWRQQYASPRYGRFAIGDQSLYSGACSTPEYDPATKLLFTLSADGELHAWDTSQRGQTVWSLNLYDRYGAKRRPEVAKRKKTQRDYGYTGSPLVSNDQLIVEVGGKTGNLVAFDVRTGRELWTSENGDEAGHTGGPVPITVDGIPCVAVLTLRNLVVTGIDGDHAGKTIATYPWTTDFGNNIATPAVFGDSVIITSAYNHFAMCRIRVSLKDGATKVWENAEVASGVCSPIIHDGRVYWAWRGLHCVDFATGKELWVGGKIGSQGSCILTADRRLIVYGNKGDLSLVESAQRSPRKYTRIAAQKVLSRTDAWPHVVLARGRILCRDRNGSIRCLAVAPELKSKATPLVAGRPTAGSTSETVTPAKPVRQVTLKGKWPGTRDRLALAWDRRSANGQVITGFEDLPELILKARENAAIGDDGSLLLRGGAFLLSSAEKPLAENSRRSSQLSIEALITSHRSNQTGPARILSFSSDGYSRNFTIGQEGNQLLLRLRTTRTGNNGMKPETRLGQIPVNRKLHLVVSYRPGQLECWINGRKTVSTNRVQGDFSNWDVRHHLLVGDEWDGGTVRKWHGRIERFAIYTRAMSADEVSHRHRLSGSPK